MLALAAALVLSALRDSIVFFNSPTDVVEKHVAPGSRIRLGGLVKAGTVQRGDNLAVRFEVTDGNKRHRGHLSGHPARPVPRRAGRGGRRRARARRRFKADTVLAKHDENYMPKEVADALKKQGRWEEGSGKHEMIAELGHYALVLALALALIQSVVPMVGARLARRHADGRRGPDRAGAVRVRRGRLRGADRVLRRLGFLGRQRVREFALGDAADLQVHQRVGQPRGLDAALGPDPGAVRRAGGGVRRQPAGDAEGQRAGGAGVDRGGVLSVHPVTSNPFLRLPQAPFEGRDLNPILQDIGLAIHPPLLYLGYVGFSISFSFAIAALIEGRIDAAWARWVRPWTLAAWMFLTLGIAMGSYWAYYELGWGGWWFWDPVENASLMPWLAGTALLHSAVVMEKRNALKVWTILLAILAFSLSLIGTFLVRSGVLTSVHAFASDPTRGVFILAILVLFIGGGLALFAWRAPALKQGGLFAPISREGALVLNNLFLTAACATVFVGTLYPLALEALTGEKISVGAPFFNLTFGPLFMPLLLVVPFGPLLAWKRGDLLGVAQRLIGAGGVRAGRDRGDVRDDRRRAGAGAVRHRARAFVMAGALTDLVERTGLLPRAVRDRVDAGARVCRARPGARCSRISGSASRCSASSAPRPGAPSGSCR